MRTIKSTFQNEALRELYNTKSKWEPIDMKFKRELYFMKAKRELNYKNLVAFHFTLILSILRF